jgi:hypothetical protein
LIPSSCSSAIDQLSDDYQKASTSSLPSKISSEFDSSSSAIQQLSDDIEKGSSSLAPEISPIVGFSSGSSAITEDSERGSSSSLPSRISSIFYYHQQLSDDTETE